MRAHWCQDRITDYHPKEGPEVPANSCTYPKKRLSESIKSLSPHLCSSIKIECGGNVDWLELSTIPRAIICIEYCRVVLDSGYRVEDLFSNRQDLFS